MISSVDAMVAGWARCSETRAESEEKERVPKSERYEASRHNRRGEISARC
jgi:hypothetical protein